MDRRQFVAGAGVGIAAAASAFPKPAIAQGVRELKMVTTWPKTLPGLQTGAERVAQSITALSGGRLQVKVFAAGQMVGALESFDAVSSGLADMYHGSEITWARSIRRILLLLQRPIRLYGRRDQRMDLLRWRSGAVGRTERGVRPQAVHVRQYRSADGWLVHQGADGRRVLQGPALPHARSRRRGAAAARRRGRQPAGWRDHPVAAVGRHRRERICRSLGRHGVGAAQGGQVLLLSRAFTSRERRCLSPSTRNCGTASAAPSAASSRRLRRPRTFVRSRNSPPTTPSRSSRLPTIRRSRFASSTTRSCKRSARSSGEVLARDQPQGRPDAAGLRELHEVPDGGRSLGRHFGARLSQCARPDVPVRGMMAARLRNSPAPHAPCEVWSDQRCPTARQAARGCRRGWAWQADCCWPSSGSAASRWSVRVWRSSPFARSATFSIASRRGGFRPRWPRRKYRDRPNGSFRPRRPCSLLRRRPSTPSDPGKSRAEMQALAALLEGLEGRGADSVALGSMRSAVSRLRTNLEMLDKLVADRIVLSERKRSHLRNALDVHAESQRLLTPWLQIVDGEIAQLRRAVNDAALGAEQRAAAGSRLGRLDRILPRVAACAVPHHVRERQAAADCGNGGCRQRARARVPNPARPGRGEADDRRLGPETAAAVDAASSTNSVPTSRGRAASPSCDCRNLPLSPRRHAI